MINPILSVVMSTYNDGDGLLKSVNSILAQDFQNFELIIVDDGSSNPSSAILKEHLANPKIKLITQKNQGITLALIAGCEAAKGQFIARHDADDVSASYRFSEQLEVFKRQADCVMVSSATRFEAPDGETMYIARLTPRDARKGLQANSAKRLNGPPHHGSVMFRNSAYQEVGGYRKQFYVAQDIDLWTRLIEVGEHISLAKILYHARFSESSISAKKRVDQVALTELVVQCRDARKKHGSDVNLLQNIPTPSAQHSNTNAVRADFYHFVGSTLLNSNPKAARKYFKRAFAAQWSRPTTLLKFLLSMIKGWFSVDHAK